MVWGLGFRVWSLGLRVQGLGFRVDNKSYQQTGSNSYNTNDIKSRSLLLV